MIRRARPFSPVHRTGVTVIVVLVMIVSSLALAYMVSRSQVATVRLQSNSSLDLSAREAALTGFAAGLRAMHEATWAGVTATVSGSLSSTQSFLVTYQTGDSTLTSTDTNWPYRVTMLVVGTASDASHPVASTHCIQTVVQLLPRQLPAEPANWSTMLQYTVFMYKSGTLQVELPSQISGSVYVQGTLQLADDYPPSNDGQSQYMSDINSMQFFGYGDNRPLTGPVVASSNSTFTSTNSNLLGWLGVSTSTSAAPSSSSWTYPGDIISYQLYAGGQSYTVAQAASSLQNTTLAGSPRTNPLGIFYNSGNVTIGNNVTLTGTLLCGGNVVISGTNVVLKPVSLPALQGSTQSIWLPTVIAQNNFQIASMASATVSGLVTCWSSFDALVGSQQTNFSQLGRVICQNCLLDDRSEWQMSGSQWNSAWSGFNNQGWSWIWFYPLYLQSKKGLQYGPNLTIVPEATPVTYHWQNATNPLYIPGSGDPGLRWTMVRWTDNYSP